MEVTPELKKYWQTNIKYVSILLTIWFVVSYVCGILFANDLDKIKMGGFPLGFWFANQGAEVTFVILIVIYVNLMNKLDKKYGVDEQ
jgi:putative solute:sodium symporter small subunit